MNRLALRAALFLLIGLSAGCQVGAGQLKGASLRVEFDGLVRDRDALSMSVLVLNPNDHKVLVEGANFNFTLEDRVPLTHEIRLDLDIAPRNRERIQIPLPTDRDVLAVLKTLDEGTRTRLSYTLEMELQLSERRPTRSRIEAFLHLVPGQSGRYR